MLMICPNCQAGYQVPDHLLAGTGRKLRCARCAFEWQAALPMADEPAELVAVVEPELALPPDERAGVPPPKGRVATALTAWTVSLVVLGSLGWGAVHWRNDIMLMWPPSERAYQAVGLN